MNLKERRKAIDKLKHEHPKLKEMYEWYSICKAVELCNETNINDKMDDSFTSLLESVEIEINRLESIVT